MKKALLISKLMLVFLLFTVWNVSAQHAYFLEGFSSKSIDEDAGWAMDNVAIISSSSIPNQVDTSAVNGAKMKVEDPISSWLQMPEVDGVSKLSFWLKLKNTDSNLAVKIQSSTDGIAWTDEVTDIPGIDLLNVDDFQEAIVPLDIDGLVSIRIFVYTSDAASSKGAFYVDDIQLFSQSVSADDVTLWSVDVGPYPLDGFDPAVTSYALEVSYAADNTVSALTTNINATAAITQVSGFDGDEAARTATIVVTGEDGTSTGTTSIVFTRGDYWYKDGFIEGRGLDGWERSRVFQDQTPNYGSTDIYPGEGALKFTGGHSTGGDNPAPGRLVSPKLKNLGILTFWASAETLNDLHELNVYIKTSDTDSTKVKSVVGSAFTVEWQEVEVEINAITDSVQIIIEGICDINDESDSRIWMDDFLLTYAKDSDYETDDATLKSLSVGGTIVEGFDSGTTSYTMEVSQIQDITVTAEATNPNATVEITQAVNASGTEAERTATVEVTSEDETATATTTIVFNLSGTSVSDFKAPEVSFYPNPAKDILNIELPEDSYQRLEIFNLSGQKMMDEHLESGRKTLSVDVLSKGVYVMSFSGKAGTFKARFIKE